MENKEKYIADFYFKTENYEAARYRYLKIIKEFESKGLLEHAKIRAAESYFELEDYRGCISFLKENARSLSEQGALKATEIVDQCAEGSRLQVCAR